MGQALGFSGDQCGIHDDVAREGSRRDGDDLVADFPVLRTTPYARDDSGTFGTKFYRLADQARIHVEGLHHIAEVEPYRSDLDLDLIVLEWLLLFCRVV